MRNQDYVFISYAHRDSAIVLPCVNALKQKGINIWYDEGIQAGSEWPEYIAEKVVSCKKFVLFVSKAYLESQNCKRELNFAVSRKKDILSVYIEDVVLSPGMEMQLGTYQAVFKNKFTNNNAFFNSLCNESWFNDCRIADTTTQKIIKEQKSNTTTYTAPRNPVYTTHAPTANNTYRAATTVPPYTSQPGSGVSAAKTNKKYKNKLVAGLLAIFLGSFGIHKFYLRQPIFGIIYILLSSTFISVILGIIDGIIILCMKQDKFDTKYNNSIIN